MIKKQYEVKEHVIKEKVCVETTLVCDMCGKKINKGGYWHCCTQHHDWGNDSHESAEYFDVCSIECMKKLFNGYCKASNNNYNTQEINITHEYWPGDVNDGN